MYAKWAVSWVPVESSTHWECKNSSEMSTWRVTSSLPTDYIPSWVRFFFHVGNNCLLDELLRLSQLNVLPSWDRDFFCHIKITVHLTGCFLRLSQLTIQPSWDRFFFHVRNNCILNELLRLAQLAFLQSSWNTCFFSHFPTCGNLKRFYHPKDMHCCS